MKKLSGTILALIIVAWAFQYCMKNDDLAGPEVAGHEQLSAGDMAAKGSSNQNTLSGACYQTWNFNQVVSSGV